MQSASPAIRPAEHEAGDFTGMLNAHQQEWCESNHREACVGNDSGWGSNEGIMKPSLCPSSHLLLLELLHGRTTGLPWTS